MKKRKIILFGAGGHCKSCMDVIKFENKYVITKLVDKVKKKVLGFNTVKFQSLPKNNKELYFGLVTVGQIKSSKLRVKLYEELVKINLKPATIISPTAIVSKNSKIEDGTIIMHNVVINSNAKIGKNCIVNTGAIIEHDVIIGNHCHIAPGAIINGGVKIEDCSFIGSGAVIKENIKISKNCIVGANTFLRKNLKKKID